MYGSWYLIIYLGIGYTRVLANIRATACILYNQTINIKVTLIYFNPFSKGIIYFMIIYKVVLFKK